MTKLIFILDQNNEDISFNIPNFASMLQIRVKGAGLDSFQNIYLNFSSEDLNYGQTFSVSDEYSWRTILLPRQISGKLTITRPFYNQPPETADGVSVIIDEIRWR